MGDVHDAFLDRLKCCQPFDLSPDLGLHDLNALLDFLIVHREQKDCDEQRIEKDQQEHEAHFAVQTQSFPQVREPTLKLWDREPEHS